LFIKLLFELINLIFSQGVKNVDQIDCSNFSAD